MENTEKDPNLVLTRRSITKIRKRERDLILIRVTGLRREEGEKKRRNRRKKQRGSNKRRSSSSSSRSSNRRQLKSNYKSKKMDL